MRKFLVALLTLVMVLSFTACGSSPEDNVVGTWYVPGLGEVEEMVFDADGTGTYELFGEPIDFEWSMEDDTTIIVTIWGMDTEYKLVGEGKDATLESDGVTAAYRDKEACQAAVDEVWNWDFDDNGGSGYTSADLEGRWEAQSAIVDGEEYTMEELDMTFELVFNADGTVDAITDGEPDGTTDYTISGTTVTMDNGNVIGEMNSVYEMTVTFVEDNYSFVMEWMQFVYE